MPIQIGSEATYHPLRAVRLPAPIFLLAILIVLGSTGCATKGTTKQTTQHTNATEGFRAYLGDCISSEPQNFSPLLIPLITSITTASMNAAGATLKKYGEDSEASFSSTVNFDNGSDAGGCIHLVMGRVYTNKADFQSSAATFRENLPLPWDALAEATLKKGYTEKKLADAKASVIKKAMSRLEMSGAMIAEKPKFFAELKLIPSSDQTKISFRLRALYYGKPLTDGWFSRNTAKALVISFAPYDPAKPAIENLKIGYPIILNTVPVGESWFSEDVLYPLGNNITAWDSPYFPIALQSKSPTTIIVGLLETTAGSKTLSVVGAALESASTPTTTALIARIDPAQQATAAAAETNARNKARTDTANATSKAIEDLKALGDAYATCTNVLEGGSPPTLLTLTKAQRDAILTYAAARVTAATSSASAEPIISSLGIDTSQVETAGNCMVSQ